MRQIGFIGNIVSEWKSNNPVFTYQFDASCTQWCKLDWLTSLRYSKTDRDAWYSQYCVSHFRLFVDKGNFSQFNLWSNSNQIRQHHGRRSSTSIGSSWLSTNRCSSHIKASSHIILFVIKLPVISLICLFLFLLSLVSPHNARSFSQLGNLLRYRSIPRCSTLRSS